MAGVLGDMELAAEAAAGLAINVAQDKEALKEMKNELDVLYDQLEEKSTRSCLLLNHSPGLAFHFMESKITAAPVTLPFNRVLFMNSFLPGAPPQLKERIKTEHWGAFVQDLNDAGTPNFDGLTTVGVFLSCTCCYFMPKLQSEFEQKVDAIIETHRENFKPHVKSMQRASTEVRSWQPSTDPLARGSWQITTLNYIVCECTESGWEAPPRDTTPISALDEVEAYV